MGNCKSNSIYPENTLINWESSTKTSPYHWWPMYEKKEIDCINNLYSKNSGLDKYDTLMGTKSIEYQKNKYSICNSSIRKDKYWAGFCNNASILSSLYEYPKYSVCVQYNDKTIIFNPIDIEALMIIASNNSIKANISLFFGLRNNKNKLKDLDEPSPSDLLYMLNIVCKNNKPFIMDIDNSFPVWNYAFDSVRVYECYTCPLKHEPPKSGSLIYYNFKIFSNGYPEQSQDLWSYKHTEYNANNEIIKQSEKWISKIHPDFIWQKYPINKPWTGKSNINPEIDANIVYYIYKHSLIEQKQSKLSTLIVY